MSWRGWLPSLPSLDFALPSSLQRRFVSFALKQSLGHLLKPGQLDVAQIDSQIGSGYVQISNLELDSQAINALLTGLPLELHEGSILSVTARIPWPNPLTATLGLSVDNLSLVFHLRPPTTEPEQHEVNVADSVASVAETFIHDELTPAEEASLRESIHHDLSASIEVQSTVPGGLDPFISRPEDENIRQEVEPSGVSIFSTLIQRLLARFAFDASNTKLMIVHPGHSCFTISVAELRYGTQQSKAEDTSAISWEDLTGDVKISGISVSARDLHPLDTEPSESAATPVQSRSVSPTSSTSSMDEDTNFSMSQSLAFLPPRPSSPAESSADSIYEDAVSSIGEDNTEGAQSSSDDASMDPEVRRAHREREAKFLSLGNDAIELRMKLKTTSQSGGDNSASEIYDPSIATDTISHIQVTANFGTASVALEAWQIRALLVLSQAWSANSASGGFPSQSAPPPTPSPFSFEVDVSLKGIVALALPLQFLDQTSEDLESFFSRPTKAPPLSTGYSRLHLDNLTLSLSSFANSLNVDFAIGDITAISFQKRVVNGGERLVALPLLLTDTNLVSSNDPSAAHPMLEAERLVALPGFDLADWTSTTYFHDNFKVSSWRIPQPKAKRERPSSAILMHGESSKSESHVMSPTPRAAVRCHVHIAVGDAVERRPGEINVDTQPLRLILDFGVVLGSRDLLNYLDEIGQAIAKDIPSEDIDRDDESGPSTPRVAQDDEADLKAEKLVLADLDLALDYREGREGTPSRGDTRPKAHRSHRGKRRSRSSPPPSPTPIPFSITCPMIRIEVSCPSPPKLHESRSGPLVLDLHGLQISSAPTQPQAPRFSEPSNPLSGASAVAIVNAQKILVAYGSSNKKVEAILSIGSLSEEPSDHPNASGASGLLPTVTLLQSSKGSITSVDVPSLHAQLSKPQVDGLQYWADDCAQFFERLFRPEAVQKSRDVSRDPSMIGSRFFTQSTVTSGSSSPSVSTGGVLRTRVSEVLLVLSVPREGDSGATRPFTVSASDLDLSLETNAEGNDKTVVSATVMDLNISNTSRDGTREQFLSLSSPRGLTSKPTPLLKLRFSALVIPETTAKESRIRCTLSDFTFTLYPDTSWISDMAKFVAAPPGAFESVVPSERTVISLQIAQGSLRALAPQCPGSVVAYLGELNTSLTLSGDSAGIPPPVSLTASNIAVLLIDDVSTVDETGKSSRLLRGQARWKSFGYALMAELPTLELDLLARNPQPLDMQLTIHQLNLRLHLCADTATALADIIADWQADLKPLPSETPRPAHRPRPSLISEEHNSANLMSSVDNIAFKKPPEVGAAADMIYDDLPRNPDYLDESFGAAAGLRELTDEDLDEFPVDEEPDAAPYVPSVQAGVSSRVGGETIKILRAEGIDAVEHHFDTLPPDAASTPKELGETTFRLRLDNTDVALFLYDGYDWAKTRKAIENGVKDMRRKLAKIKQLLATGQIQDPSLEETSALLFNSVYVGLEQDPDALEPGALISAIDDELKDDETATQSSWQPLGSPAAGASAHSPASHRRTHSSPSGTKLRGKKLTRSHGPRIEFELTGVHAEVDVYRADEPSGAVSRVYASVRDVEILDHIRASTWKKFLTGMGRDARGNVRETGSSMVKVELVSVRPVPGHPSEEARLRAKILPLRLYVDQLALEFMKQFFSFKDESSGSGSTTAEPAQDDGGVYFQFAEIFPVDLKLDYKPRKVDYRALKEGRTIELMNFFHFDGAEMTLRHITLAGISGWPRLFDLLNDIWTPDVKATQLVDVISGVSPIRSVVNVGSGVADLVLLPIAQYKKDGRVVRGVQRGAESFVRSAGMEVVKVGARLATGTQVILEGAEGVLGGGGGVGGSSSAGKDVMAESIVFDEALLRGEGGEPGEDDEGEEDGELISRYAEQPMDVREGVQTAVKSLRRNLNSAAQTILAVPMEMYERSGNEGPVRSVIRAVPIAVLKPMIGASEAVSKTLLGLHNQLDPGMLRENEEKYKHRS